MIIGIQGEKISVEKDTGEKIEFTAIELFALKKLYDSMFGKNPTHYYVTKSEYENLKRIKEIGIELLDACKKTRETNTPYHVIQKFHDFKFAIFGKEKRF